MVSSPANDPAGIAEMSDSWGRWRAGKRRRWPALAVLLIGSFMALLDTTIVNVAVPTIQTGLDASDAAVSWVVAG